MRKFKFTFVLLAFFTLFTACANDVVKVPADELHDYISSLKEPGTYKIKITGLESLDEFPKYSDPYGHDIYDFSSILLDNDIYIDLSATEIPNGMDVKGAFVHWKNLVASPKFLGTVKDNSLEETFVGCTSLKKVTNLPKKLTDMYDTFWECTSLTTAPEIPDSVTNMERTFLGCTSLTTAPKIPDSVTNMENTFCECESLATAPRIPDSVTNMKFTFYCCRSLKIVEFFPDRAAFNEWGKATRDSISNYAAECFYGVPSTCKIYVDADSLWNNIDYYEAKIIEEYRVVPSGGMFVVKL